MADNMRTARRTDALSKQRIVDASIGILDEQGEEALTFRALAARLATGPGAIYWYVADKEALLAAATDQIISEVTAKALNGSGPQEAIRTLALGVFDAIDAHPWIGARLSRAPEQHAVLRILEGLGSQVQALGVPEQTHFNAATALLSLILGLAGQYAAHSRFAQPNMDRRTLLEAVAARWRQLDAEKHPFLRQVAAKLPDHDDRAQFLAGVDLILAGMLAG